MSCLSLCVDTHPSWTLNEGLLAYNAIPNLIQDFKTQHTLELLPLERISFLITIWYKPDPNKNYYLAMRASANIVHEDEPYSLSIVDGHCCDTNECIIDGDGFVRIKTDHDSIRQAVNDALSGIIPLWNRVDYIDNSIYTYVYFEE